MRPYAGLHVVEVGAAVASALAGKLFAELGATVQVTGGPRFVDAEPVVDGVSTLATFLDGAKSVLPEGPLPRADLVLLADRDSPVPVPEGDPVVVGFGDFGPDGPYAGWSGGELVLQALTGLLDLVGKPGGTPVVLGGHQIAYSQGVAGFTAATVALHERERSGRGQRVTVSGYATGAYLEWKGRTYAQAGTPLVRGERSGPVVVAAADGPFGLYYRRADWPRVVAALEAPELDRPPFDEHAGRLADPDGFRAAVEAVTTRHTRAELTERLQRARVPSAPVLDTVDLLDSPQYAHRGLLRPAPGGQGRMPAFPALINGVRPHADSSPTATEGSPR